MKLGYEKSADLIAASDQKALKDWLKDWLEAYAEKIANPKREQAIASGNDLPD